MRANKKRGTVSTRAGQMMTTVPTELAKVRADISLRQRKHIIEFFISVIFGMLASILASVAVFLSSSNAPQIPQAYVYLAGIVLSSLAGISIVFLIARKIYQERKRERIEAIKGVRIRENQLFETIEHDFENLVKHRELHGG